MSQADPAPEATGEGTRLFVKVSKGIGSMDETGIREFAYRLIDAIAAAFPAPAPGDAGPDGSADS